MTNDWLPTAVMYEKPSPLCGMVIVETLVDDVVDVDVLVELVDVLVLVVVDVLVVLVELVDVDVDEVEVEVLVLVVEVDVVVDAPYVMRTFIACEGLFWKQPLSAMFGMVLYVVPGQCHISPDDP
jgi:hypothetical protein